MTISDNHLDFRFFYLPTILTSICFKDEEATKTYEGKTEMMQDMRCDRFARAGYEDTGSVSNFNEWQGRFAA